MDLSVETKGYIYVAQHLYCGENEEGVSFEIKDKKIGKTIDISQREYSLNRTKSPIRIVLIAAWEVDKMDVVERVLHKLLEEDNTTGEWFVDPDDTMVDRIDFFMHSLCIGQKVVLHVHENQSALERLLIKNNTPTTEEEHITNLDETLKNVYIQFRDSLLAIGEQMKITAVTGNYISFGVRKAIVYCLFQSNRIRLSARGTIFEDTIFRRHETNTRTRYVYELYPENVDTIPDIIRAVHKKYQQQVFVER